MEFHKDPNAVIIEVFPKVVVRTSGRPGCTHRMKLSCLNPDEVPQGLCQPGPLNIHRALDRLPLL